MVSVNVRHTNAAEFIKNNKLLLSHHRGKMGKSQQSLLQRPCFDGRYLMLIFLCFQTIFPSKESEKKWMNNCKEGRKKDQ